MTGNILHEVQGKLMIALVIICSLLARYQVAL